MFSICSLHDPPLLQTDLELGAEDSVRRVQALKQPMLPTILKVCKFVQKAEFNESLVYFDLLDESEVRSLQEDDDAVYRGWGSRKTWYVPQCATHNMDTASDC